jgi:hypothetical protein
LVGSFFAATIDLAMARRSDHVTERALDVFWSMQRYLSRFCAYPVLGVVPSVVKVLIAGLQIALGFAIAVIGVFVSIATCFTIFYPLDAAQFGIAFIIMGGLHLGYAVANIVTLSIVGYCCEPTLGKTMDDCDNDGCCFRRRQAPATTSSV